MSLNPSGTYVSIVSSNFSLNVFLSSLSVLFNTSNNCDLSFSFSIIVFCDFKMDSRLAFVLPFSSCTNFVFFSTFFVSVFITLSAAFNSFSFCCISNFDSILISPISEISALTLFSLNSLIVVSDLLILASL